MTDGPDAGAPAPAPDPTATAPTPAPAAPAKKRSHHATGRPRGRPRKVPPITATGGGDRAGVTAWAQAPEGTAPDAVPSPAPSAPRAKRSLSKVTKEQLAADLDARDREIAGLKAQLTPGEDRAQLETVLVGVLKTAAEIAARVTRVPDAKLEAGEAETMAAALAPPLAPFLAAHGDKAPWALAVVTCAGVLFRPVMAVLDARERARLAPVLPAPDAPRAADGAAA